MRSPPSCLTDWSSFVSPLSGCQFPMKLLASESVLKNSSLVCLVLRLLRSDCYVGVVYSLQHLSHAQHDLFVVQNLILQVLSSSRLSFVLRQISQNNQLVSPGLHYLQLVSAASFSLAFFNALSDSVNRSPHTSLPFPCHKDLVSSFHLAAIAILLSMTL